MAFLTRGQLMKMGFAGIGDNVLISDKATIYGTGRITIGSNVRIDDFCVISAGSGGIEIGSYVHVAVYVSLIGAGKITLSDFCGLSSKVAVYSSNDDYSGEHLTNPMVPTKYTKVEHADVFFGRHVIVGAGSVVLPGITIEEGASVGAMSFVNKNLESFGVYFGVPARRVGKRKERLLELEEILEKSVD